MGHFRHKVKSKGNPVGRPSLWPELNLERIADEAGVSVQHLSNVLNGNSGMSLSLALRLAEVWSLLYGRKVRVEDLKQEIEQRLKQKEMD